MREELVQLTFDTVVAVRVSLVFVGTLTRAVGVTRRMVANDETVCVRTTVIPHCHGHYKL